MRLFALLATTVLALSPMAQASTWMEWAQPAQGSYQLPPGAHTFHTKVECDSKPATEDSYVQWILDGKTVDYDLDTYGNSPDNHFYLWIPGQYSVAARCVDKNGVGVAPNNAAWTVTVPDTPVLREAGCGAAPAGQVTAATPVEWDSRWTLQELGAHREAWQRFGAWTCGLASALRPFDFAFTVDGELLKLRDFMRQELRLGDYSAWDAAESYAPEVTQWWTTFENVYPILSAAHATLLDLSAVHAIQAACSVFLQSGTASSLAGLRANIPTAEAAYADMASNLERAGSAVLDFTSPLQLVHDGFAYIAAKAEQSSTWSWTAPFFWMLAHQVQLVLDFIHSFNDAIHGLASTLLGDARFLHALLTPPPEPKVAPAGESPTPGPGTRATTAAPAPDLALLCVLLVGAWASRRRAAP